LQKIINSFSLKAIAKCITVFCKIYFLELTQLISYVLLLYAVKSFDLDFHRLCSPLIHSVFDYLFGTKSSFPFILLAHSQSFPGEVVDIY